MGLFRHAVAGSETVSPADLEQMLLRGGEPVRVLDVRSPAEFAEGHIPGAVNIPHTEVRSRGLAAIGGGEGRIVVACAHGGRARMAAAVLRELGCRDVVLLEGHMCRWIEEGRPLVRSCAG